MLKAGVFLDSENLMRNGGWGMRYHVVRELVAAHGAEILRANAYLAIDREREQADPAHRRAREEFRNAIRRAGFHLVLKEVRRYRDASGEEVLKANADLDLAVDALLQVENLDWVLLGSGDGDFLRLVRAIQGRGRRVDLLSFGNTSGELRREVDNHFSGFLIPGLVPAGATDRVRGFLHFAEEAKGFGFLTVRTGLGPDDVRDDVFCHIRDFRQPIDNAAFAALKTREAILEFTMAQDRDGRDRAVAIEEVGFAGRQAGSDG